MKLRDDRCRRKLVTCLLSSAIIVTCIQYYTLFETPRINVITNNHVAERRLQWSSETTLNRLNNPRFSNIITSSPQKYHVYSIQVSTRYNASSSLAHRAIPSQQQFVSTSTNGHYSRDTTHKTSQENDGRIPEIKLVPLVSWLMAHGKKMTITLPPHTASVNSASSSSSSPSYAGVSSHNVHPLPTLSTSTLTTSSSSDDHLKEQLLLVTYFRGGSTFLGELFNVAAMAGRPMVSLATHGPDVGADVPLHMVYWYEPLKGLYLDAFRSMIADGVMENYDSLYAMNRNHTLSVLSEQHYAGRVAALAGLLSCRPDRLPPALLNDSFLTTYERSASLAVYTRCIQVTPHSPDITHCLRHLTTVCSMAHRIVVKTIRLALYMLRMEHPNTHGGGGGGGGENLKVVYYVRDPRAIIASRLSPHLNDLSIAERHKYHHYAPTFCELMQRDLETFDRLNRQFPGRLLLVRYEDLAKNPLPETQKIFQFSFKIRVPQVVKDWLSQNTREDDAAHAPYSTKRNSARAADKWRHKIAPKVKAVMDADPRCQSVLRRLRYEL